MRRKPGFWVLLSLVALLCFLGYLQYEWIDRLARAEREREQQALRAALARISGAFDVEITRALLAFGNGPQRRGGPPMPPPPGMPMERRSTPEEHHLDDDSALADRAQSWLDYAPFPRLVKDVFVTRGSQTLRVTPSGVTPVTGPPSSSEFVFDIPMRGPWDEQRSVVFDGEFIRQDLLPRLIGRHLDMDRYAVRVDGSQGVIYTRGTLAASETMPLFDFRPECFMGGPMRREFMRRGPQQRGDALSMISRSHVTCDDVPRAGEPGRWTLRAGLIAASSSGLREFRTRTLLLGFGVLAVLAIGIGMLGVYWHRAQILAQRQMEFAMAVSHELRTPLTVIRVAADSLADGMVKDPTKYGALIRKETTRLSDMVEQVLVFARTQRSDVRPQLEPVAPGAVIDRALGAVDATLQQAGIKVDRDVPENIAMLRADVNLLSAALQNLFINAAKYAAAGEVVHVKAERAEPGYVRIVVQDNGPGVRPTDLPRVFSAFYRAADAANSSVPGLGLGLHLVKRIVDAHGGSVRASNREGAGGFEVEMRIPSIES